MNYLTLEIKNGADSHQQEIYPEGYLFTNALVALSIIEYCEIKNDTSSKYLFQIETLLDKIISKQATSSFTKNLPLDYGAFYNGWINFCFKKFLLSNISNYSLKRNKYSLIYEERSEKIIKVFKNNNGLIESYAGSSWYADNLICLASLPDTDKNDLFITWSAQLNKEKYLFPHDGYSDLVRGSSSALSVFLLNEIDPKYARNANQQFTGQFARNIFGAMLIKEFKDQVNQEVDIDSGPIVSGYGSVATIMNIKTQIALAENDSSSSTWGLLNLLSVPVVIDQRKFYLFKQVFMYDVFMLWVGVGLLK